MQSVYEKDFPEIFEFIKEDKIAIYYNPSQRSFSIGGIDGYMKQEIAFCPWSGKKLPKSLLEEFSAKLESLDLCIFEKETWPEGWRSEAWWIKEGL
jgi:hypothetical protein